MCPNRRGEKAKVKVRLWGNPRKEVNLPGLGPTETLINLNAAGHHVLNPEPP